MVQPEVMTDEQSHQAQDTIGCKAVMRLGRRPLRRSRFSAKPEIPKA